MIRHLPHRLTLIASCVAACTLTAGLVACDSDESTPASTADAAADSQASALLARMTQDEKIQLVHGAGLNSSPIGGAGYIPGIARLGIPDIISADSAGGVNVSGVNATPLPSPLALAASWDPDLANEYGSRIAIELRTLGFTMGLGGGVDLAREPRNGRTFEYMGEDPLLAGEMIAQRTVGTQAQKVIATIKHYAMNDQETNRTESDSEADERTMRELHLLPFEIGVTEGVPGNVMCAYNLVNGEKACQNHSLLTDTLKTEWGFQGTVQSDWLLAVTDTVLAANAGLDEEQAGSTDDSVGTYGIPTYFNQKLKAAVAAGTVAQSRLDDMVQRKLRTLYRLGIMDSPATTGGTIDQDAGNATALKVAQQSMVLLKNATATGDSASVLPLSASGLASIVVIGGHADVCVISGGGSGGAPARDGNAVACLTPDATADSSGIFTACATWYKSAPLAAIRALAPNATVTYLDGSDAAAAATAAAAADVAIVFATQWETESADLPGLALPDNAADPANQAYDQNALIAAVTAAARRSVAMLETGTAVTMPWISGAHAVLEAWYPGVQGGPAIASLLFGTVNPSGKLPISFPRADADLVQKTISATDLAVVYSEGLEMGYRWYDAQQITPLFPFGYGLSYTSYAYSGLTSSADGAGNVSLGFTLKNTGAVAGSEVAQVYATLPAALGEPPQRLVGWKKVALKAGESQTVSLTIPAQRLKIWDATNHAWKLGAGSYTLAVGASSRDTQRLSGSFTVAGS